MAYQEDQLTKTIIECIIKVHKSLGPGFLESIYRKALMIELKSHGLFVEMEKEEKADFRRLEGENVKNKTTSIS